MSLPAVIRQAAEAARKLGVGFLAQVYPSARIAALVVGNHHVSENNGEYKRINFAGRVKQGKHRYISYYSHKNIKS